MRTIRMSGVAAAVCLAAGGAHGGANLPPDGGTAFTCPATTDCKVAVSASAANVKKNDCGVAVVDRVIYPAGATVGLPLVWSLNGGGVVGNIQFRFAPQTGVVLSNNSAGGQPVFTPLSVAGGVNFSNRRAVAVQTSLPYTINLQWRKVGASAWSTCTPYDPIIVNEV